MLVPTDIPKLSKSGMKILDKHKNKKIKKKKKR